MTGSAGSLCRACSQATKVIVVRFVRVDDLMCVSRAAGRYHCGGCARVAKFASIEGFWHGDTFARASTERPSAGCGWVYDRLRWRGAREPPAPEKAKIPDPHGACCHVGAYGSRRASRWSVLTICLMAMPRPI